MDIGSRMNAEMMVILSMEMAVVTHAKSNQTTTVIITMDLATTPASTETILLDGTLSPLLVQASVSPFVMTV